MKNIVNFSVPDYGYKDKLLNNLFRKHYLDRDGWDSKLQSLIPPNFWYFDPEDKKMWYVDTPCQFFEESGKAARYIILVRWKFDYDKRGFIRAFRTNGWYRSKNIRYFDRQKGDWIEGKERKEFIDNKLLPRIKKTLGAKYKTLNNKTIMRYRFNFACYYTGGNLCDQDGHHENMDNPTAAERVKPDLKGLYDFWLLATDDRPYNILPMTPETHNKEHEKLGDTRYEFYRKSDFQIDSSPWDEET